MESHNNSMLMKLSFTSQCQTRITHGIFSVWKPIYQPCTPGSAQTVWRWTQTRRIPSCSVLIGDRSQQQRWLAWMLPEYLSNHLTRSSFSVRRSTTSWLLPGMSIRFARRHSSTFEHCDTFGAYWQRTWLRPSRVRWWAQGWTTPTQFCTECRARTSTNCNVCKTPSPGLSSSRKAIRAWWTYLRISIGWLSGIASTLKSRHWCTRWGLRRSRSIFYHSSQTTAQSEVCSTGTRIPQSSCQDSRWFACFFVVCAKSLEQSTSWHRRMYHTVDFSP